MLDNKIDSTNLRKMISRNKNDIIYTVVLFIIPFIVFAPIIFLDININIGDGIGYEISHAFFRQVIFGKELPLWNKYIALGTSHIGDIQQKCFYPLTWICALLPQRFSFKFFYVLHISLANCFMYCLCKDLMCNAIASVFGAVLFSFSNLVVIRYEHINILCCIIWIPLILHFLLGFYRKDKLYYLISMAFAMGLQFMAGFPQISFYSDMFIFVFMLYLNIKYKKTMRYYCSSAIKLGLMYIIICLVQILPLYEIMKYSGRDSITYEYFSDGAANLLLILDMLAPKATGDFGSLISGGHEFPTDTYLGIIPLSLIMYALAYMRKNRDIIFLLIYSAFALIFACACSNFTIIGKIIYHLPLIGSFRTTTRMLIFFVVPLMIIAILALKDIFLNDSWEKLLQIVIRLLFVTIVLHVISKVWSSFTDSKIIDYYSDNNVWIKSMFLLLILAIGLFIKIKFGKNRQMGILLAILVVTFQVMDVYVINIDESTCMWRVPYLLKARTYEETFESDVNEMLKKNANSGTRYLVDFYTWDELAKTSWALRPNGNVLSSLAMVQSYITFNNPMLLKIANTDYGMMMNSDLLMASSNPSLIRLLNIEYLVKKDNQKPLGRYENKGVVYEEYMGRRPSDGETISLGKSISGSYFSISIDAVGENDGCNIKVVTDDGRETVLGKITPDERYYNFTFCSRSISNVELVFEDGNNVIINGLRVEKNIILDKENTDYKKVYDDGDYSIYKNDGAVGHVFVFDNAYLIDNPKDYVINNKEFIRFDKDAYVESDSGIGEIRNAKGKVNNIVETNNNVVAQTEIETEKAMIALSESYYPGWKAYIDGKRTNIYCVDNLIQGIVVPKGDHVIEFRYSPDSLKVGGLVSCIGCFGFIAIYITQKRRNQE